jgi:ABC-type lipoprotein export system ATPase subunit
MIDLHDQGHTIVFITHDHQLIDYVRDKTHIKIIKLW